MATPSAEDTAEHIARACNRHNSVTYIAAFILTHVCPEKEDGSLISCVHALLYPVLVQMQHLNMITTQCHGSWTVKQKWEHRNRSVAGLGWKSRGLKVHLQPPSSPPQSSHSKKNFGGALEGLRRISRGRGLEPPSRPTTRSAPRIGETNKLTQSPKRYIHTFPVLCRY
jgi:hypothetical protein